MSILADYAVPPPPLIVPRVGGGRERDIQATIDAYREVARRIADLAPETIVISSRIRRPTSTTCTSQAEQARAEPSRSSATAPTAAALPTTKSSSTPCAVLRMRVTFLPAPAGERNPDLDWGVLVPLHFVQEEYEQRADTGVELPAYRVVRIGLSGLSPRAHYQLGELVQHVAEELGRRCVFIASGDLSHKLKEDGPYGFAPDGPVFDDFICRAFSEGDLLSLLTADPGMCERAAECGLRSFQIMAGALDRTPVRAELLSHEGPFGVGYGIAAFTPTGAAGSDASRAIGDQYDAWHADDMARRKAAESPWVQLARYSLESYVREGRRIDPAHNLPDDLANSMPDELFSTQAGAFVSLKKDGQLRGCIGTILPTRDTLAAEICANAVSAGCRDPRFSPIKADELDELVYDVDVLSAPERISGPEELDPKRYGVIVSASRGRRGLLLPDLDGVDTVEEQIRIAARKGGINPDESSVTLERFTVTRHL